MSWSGFKKNVGRATTQVMMKTGHVEKTSDREYEVEERRYRTLESASLRLQKEAKGYLDSLRAMTASQMRIAETIDAFYGESGAKDGVSRSYKQAVEDLDAETVKALDGPYRCVTQDPELRKLVPFDEDTGMYQEGVLEEVEAELNWQAGNKRNYTKEEESDYDGAVELIQYVYRTTVLEPINRFCAYFPDINECIKKRNHKMLDYDSMRSKVKKLTEKPDKDPSKLPRTEKETEMVKKHSLRFSRIDDLLATLMEDDDLLFPSPPKVLNGIKRNQSPLDRIKADEDAAMESVGLKRRSSLMDRMGRVGSLVGNAFGSSPGSDLSAEKPLLAPPSPSNMDSPAASSPSPSVRSKKPSWSSSFHESPSSNKLQTLKEFLDEDPPESPTTRKASSYVPPSPRPTSQLFGGGATFSAFGGVGMIPPTSPHSTYDTKHVSLHPNTPKRSVSVRTTPRSKKTPGSSSPRFSVFSPRNSDIPSITSSLSGDKRNRETSTPSRTIGRTGLFHPSELEEIMAPLKQEFIEAKTDELKQAKVAYDQLNTQLTDELPQLIDLRVPYLDPTFEALVKIQLRFCAEAYSRMAQVQQYLAAETRDQYASGDLDARVEDVLGQIRELSIAGTV
ncbi:hypothetical protein PRZ48_006946 [Zasmidium cellare]|uniref:BAR domain-containing protein n=1 Tax=Zasmidium cellare TaxID=395010 RepID=A0ABR0EI11_ZASCE|nr:hypothetical protein PRZ48_006946 [Zasmidium cellare]